MTYDTIADLVFVSLTLGAVTAYAVSAQAGAPGPQDEDGAIVVILPDGPQVYAADLSPAEIRNAASIRADLLEARGISVDRTALFGIGLDRDDLPADAARLAAR
ncbi:MAG: hypothetical protein WBG08_13410 [Litorimonas sp.]